MGARARFHQAASSRSPTASALRVGCSSERLGVPQCQQFIRVGSVSFSQELAFSLMRSDVRHISSSGSRSVGVAAAVSPWLTSTRLACAGARDRGTCDNHLTICRDEVEARVLKAMEDGLWSESRRTSCARSCRGPGRSPRGGVRERSASAPRDRSATCLSFVTGGESRESACRGCGGKPVFLVLQPLACVRVPGSVVGQRCRATAWPTSSPIPVSPVRRAAARSRQGTASARGPTAARSGRRP